MTETTDLVYVDNVPKEASEEEIAKLFSRAGTVVWVRPIVDENKERLDFAFVKMSSHEEAEAAVKLLDGAVLRDYTLYVRLSFPPKE